MPKRINMLVTCCEDCPFLGYDFTGVCTHPVGDALPKYTYNGEDLPRGYLTIPENCPLPDEEAS